MDQKTEKSAAETTAGQPAPLRISRVFAAPRALVFAAWSSAEHVKHWFCPEAYTIPEATVEMRVGGTFAFLMRGPGGDEHQTRGTVAELLPNERLVLDLHVVGDDGQRLFEAYTEVDFSDDAGGTRIDVVQSYVFTDPDLAAMMVAGAPEGWSQTLDKLGREVERMQAIGAGPSA